MHKFVGQYIHPTKWLYSGELYFVKGEGFWLGTKPIDNKEWCRRRALEIVHEGLADVLEWLGEKPYKAPPSHMEFIRALSR